jgi:uncharacterized SAM-binding protein YcdF (DUF218 family)
VIGRLLAGLILLWMLGFALFASTLPGSANGQVTDGVIVLTGGPGRLQHALAALDRGKAKRMLISGVDRQVKPHELAIAYHIPARLMARIDLGHESVDTRSNADEAEAWIEHNHYRSIRLITTNWHMPRAKLELVRVRRTGVSILADAVPSEPSLRVLVREYNKFLLRCAASLAGF